MQNARTDKLNVVVYLNDGTRRKGVTEAFDPRKSILLVQEIDVAGHVVAIHDVDMPSVRAVFFVRDLALMRTSRLSARDGDPQPVHEPRPGARLVRVSLVWGELVDGYTYDYDPKGRGFNLYPAGPLSRAHNILRIWVSNKAATRVEVRESYGMVPGPEPASEVPAGDAEAS